jgi:hypothetical protein
MAVDAGRAPRPASSPAAQPTPTPAAPTTTPAFRSLTRNVDAFEKLEQIGEGTYG